MPEALSQQAFSEADEVIKSVLTHSGHDYTSKRVEIAEHFDNVLWEGNWVATLDFTDMPRLKFMQEDEYDQHMGDDPPDYDVFAGGHYIIIGNGPE